MSKSSSQYLTQSEIESIKELDSWQRFQMERYNSILREYKRHPIMEELANQEQDTNGNNNFQNSIHQNTLS